MVITIEKQHIEIINNLAKDANFRGRKLQIGKPENYTKHRKFSDKQDISVDVKKRVLMNRLYQLAINTFAVDIKKTSRKIVLGQIKNNIRILRKITIRLKNINYYLETTFLEDIGLVKPKPFFETTIKEKMKLLKQEKGILDKNELDTLEYSVFRLIDKIIMFDKRLLAKYKMNEEIIEKKEILSEQNLISILKKESELCRYLEAKFPPAKYIKDKLLNQEMYTNWVSRILSIMAILMLNYQKEQEIIKKLKKEKALKDIIEKKISHLVREKWDMLKVKEKKILDMEKTSGLDGEWQKMSHDWSTVTNL